MRAHAKSSIAAAASAACVFRQLAGVFADYHSVHSQSSLAETLHHALPIRFVREKRSELCTDEKGIEPMDCRNGALTFHILAPRRSRRRNT
jgi:DICT domain-containing protein